MKQITEVLHLLSSPPRSKVAGDNNVDDNEFQISDLELKKPRRVFTSLR